MVFQLFLALLVFCSLIFSSEGLISGKKNVVVKEGMLADEHNSSLILAGDRTYRKDPLDNYKRYEGGWNISEIHYWSSVGYTGAPYLIVAIAWFAVFGLSLMLLCCCYFFYPHPPGYSERVYFISCALLVLFTLSSVVGCSIVYTGQEELDRSTGHTLEYIVQQAYTVVDDLKNVSNYFAAAKRIGLNSFFLGAAIQIPVDVDALNRRINSSAVIIVEKTENTSDRIHGLFYTVRKYLIIIASVALVFTVLGFLFSYLGVLSLVISLVVVGSILATGIFILCGVFLVLQNVLEDTCVSVNQWVLHPTAYTALDEILPCMDKATADETLLRSKEVTYQLVVVVNQVIANLSNANFTSVFGHPLNYNQSGPPIPMACNPYNPDLTFRTCETGEVMLTEVWKHYVCKLSSDGSCYTVGRLTPDYYSQMTAAANISFGLSTYGPILVRLADCSFMRNAFKEISIDHCPKLKENVKLDYIGLVTISAAVIPLLIFSIVYTRERRHRLHTKQGNVPNEPQT